MRLGRGKEGALPFAAAFSTRPFNVLANLASVIGAVVAVAAVFTWDLTVVPLLYVCGVSAFLLARYVRHERWGRYAEGVQVMERAFRRLTEATDELNSGQSQDARAFLVALQGSLSAFAEAFTLVTGSNCRATLKELYLGEVSLPAKPGDAPRATQVLCAATVLRSELDSGPAVYDEAPVLVEENSDFLEVFETGKPFFSNDLEAAWRRGDYRNSHWTSDMRTSRTFPYRSAIVWPVRVDPRSNPRAAPEKAIAFLCVDSQRRRAFVRLADVAFGGGYAHALYPALAQALKIMSATTGRTHA